jgi:hypothetical protein
MNDPNDVSYGIGLFAMGWAGMFGGVYNWFANPIYIMGMASLLWNAPKVARGLMPLALLIGLETWMHTKVAFVADVAGGGQKLMYPLIGFYVWIASLIVGTVAAWLPDERPLEPTPETPE